MLRRKAFSKIEDWNKRNEAKALCILGARQIGKTTIVREFAKVHYSQFIELNFIKEPDAVKIFEGDLDAQTILLGISAYKKTRIKKGECLIFLDEIQKCPRARAAIKFLVEDGTARYIESGSLLGTTMEDIPSVPVGFEEGIEMYPMDFEEFLWASGIGTDVIEYLKDCYENKKEASPSIHDSLIKLFYRYIVVGGMPEVVQKYVLTNDMKVIADAQKDILRLYRQDIAQYASSHDKVMIADIFDAIPAQLNSKNRRFIASSIGKYIRVSRNENCFKWLTDAGVALASFNVEAPQLPLNFNSKRSLFRLYMGDTGLLVAATMQNIQLAIIQGDLSVNMDSILENLFAQSLKANGFGLYYFESKKHGEVDFIVEDGMEVSLIEVKSGNDYRRHKALNNISAVEEWRFGKKIVFCKSNVKEENEVLYLPWYMVMFYKPWEPASTEFPKIEVPTLPQ